MRHFFRRFRRALRTIPIRVRLILFAPVAFVTLFAIDGRSAILALFAVLGWLIIRELQGSHTQGDDDITDGMINPATGLMMDGGIDTGGNLYGCGHDHN